MLKIIDLLKKYSIAIFLLFIAVITIGSLWPRFSEHYQTGEISSGLRPQEGDNFKMVNVAAVYRFENGKRRRYETATSFFNHSDNLPFDTPYEEGGILICDKEVVFSIPMGDYMPETEGGVAKAFKYKSAWQKFKEGFFRTDKLAHFFSYAIFAILLLLLLQQHSRWGKGSQILAVLLLGTLFGGGIEYLQFEFIPGRDKELLDLLFNSLGLLVGIYFYFKIDVRR